MWADVLEQSKAELLNFHKQLSWSHYSTLLTLDVQVHALLMAPDPAQSFTVKSTQIGELHSADGQHGLPVTTSDFNAAVLTLGTHNHTTRHQ